MRDVELYQQLLGLVAPWAVGRVELSVQGERVDIWAEHAPEARWPGRVRKRAVLAPAGDPAIDQARIAPRARFGTQPQTLHRAGTKSFHQCVGFPDQRQRKVDPLGALEVEHHGPAPAAELSADPWIAASFRKLHRRAWTGGMPPERRVHSAAALLSDRSLPFAFARIRAEGPAISRAATTVPPLP
jgi:hypothetical protein